MMPDRTADAAGAKVTADVAADTASIKIAWTLTGIAFLLSYRGLYDFARYHGGQPRWAALLWPLIIDTLTVLGELRLYSGTRRGEAWYIKAWGWALVLAGMIASTAANAAGAGSPLGYKLAAVAAPVVAAAALGTGLGLVKLRFSPQQQDGKGTVVIPAGAPSAARPVTARARSRQGSAAGRVPRLVPAALADREAGLPMGHAALASRRGWTDHTAKLVLAAMPTNGDHPHDPES